jgi:hypothetical protein
MYLSNPTPTLLSQTLAWGSFKANDNQMPTFIFSNTLRLNFTGLTPNTAYNWTIKVQKGLPNVSALDGKNFMTGAGETTKSLNIYLTAGVYNVGNTYFFGLAQAVTGGEEGIQFDFKIDNRITLDTGGSTITGQLLNQAFSYSGQSFDVLTNRFLDELSLEKTNITAFTNAKIPTTLALQAYITSLNLPTRDYLDPANIIYAQIIIVRDRFLAEGLTFPNWKFYSLENLYRQIITATQSTILPDFLIMPNLSSDTSAPTSTRLINLGIGSANITINGSTVGSMIQPDHFLFDGVNDWLSSSVSQNGSGVGFTTHARVRSGISTLQNIFGSSTIEAGFTSLINGTFHIARSFDSNDGNGIGRGSSDFVINSDRKYSATYNGSNVVAGIKTYTNGVQTDSVNSNTGTFVSSRNTGAGNLVVGTRRNVDSYFSGRIYSAISWIGRELNYGQIQNINNLTVL